jgi:hypothetical protein
VVSGVVGPGAGAAIVTGGDTVDEGEDWAIATPLPMPTTLRTPAPAMASFCLMFILVFTSSLS